jgi:hypothetical protein
MGRKHSRQRKHIFLYLACWLSFSIISAGCSPLYYQYDEEGRLYQQGTEARQLLLQAKSSFANGDFLVSFKESQEILTRFPQKYGDHALYIMGLVYANPEYLYTNSEISIHYFDRLIKEYPKSAFKTKATILIGLLNQNVDYSKLVDNKNKHIVSLKKELSSQKKQIDSLLNQIKQLKEIDLGIEEKKREALPKIGR